ncbi:hypothetical protein Taro_010607 [Colocasia esculenta]|uniref:Uncharacterized protein n=1 Tax=Colocasia esculenta TaxID=4460 RepID=A0A843TZE5_COLES|nr:hypothetical protein [Colocasia esculenta]
MSVTSLMLICIRNTRKAKSLRRAKRKRASSLMSGFQWNTQKVKSLKRAKEKRSSSPLQTCKHGSAVQIEDEEPELFLVPKGLIKPAAKIDCQTVRALKTMVIAHPGGHFTVFYAAEEQPMRRDDDCKIPEETGDPLVPIIGFSDMSSAVTRLAERQQIPLCQRLSQREMFRKLWYPPNMDRDLLKITQHPGLGLSLGESYTVGMISIANQTEESHHGWFMTTTLKKETHLQ